MMTIYHIVITDSQFALKYCYLKWQIYRTTGFSWSKICEVLVKI